MQKKYPLLYNNREIEAVIFDVDGTLYSQRKMHMYMICDLLFYYLRHPLAVDELRIIYLFRKIRYSVLEGNNLERSQYTAVAVLLKISEEKVRAVVAQWIEKRPLRYIKRCRYSYMPELFRVLQQSNMCIAAVSDYPVVKKLHALELTAEVMVCSTDRAIEFFKPNPKGFLFAADSLGVPPKNCLVIGDREDKDGEAARRAGMLYLQRSPEILTYFKK